MSTTPRHALLVMPGYGEASMGAARGFWRSSHGPGLRVDCHYVEGSLLANNFNQLWCEGLNRRRRGNRLDYWAMQHSDVEPEDWWLDTLTTELEEHDLDVLGVVVPIKDQRGVTSIALAHESGDPFRTHCRLTMQDCYRLPATFTSADVGRPILLNTGLWVCRFDPAWADRVHFEIRDRIVFNDATDEYQAQNESEDWHFSRQLHALGLKVGCTRKIKLTHRGPAQFPNDRGWGHPWDQAAVDESPLPDVPPSGRFVLPPINGWLRQEEGEALAELARGKRVLEVGSYCGLSTVSIARTAASVVSVDTHDGRGTAVPASTIETLKANLSRFGVREKVGVFRGTLADYRGRSWSYPDPFDLIFIDGDHDREAVEADAGHALALLAPGGLLAFHDYAHHLDPGVTEAVDALISRGAELVSLTESLAVVRPPAEVPQPVEV